MGDLTMYLYYIDVLAGLKLILQASGVIALLIIICFVVIYTSEDMFEKRHVLKVTLAGGVCLLMIGASMFIPSIETMHKILVLKTLESEQFKGETKEAYEFIKKELDKYWKK